MVRTLEEQQWMLRAQLGAIHGASSGTGETEPAARDCGQARQRDASDLYLRWEPNPPYPGFID